MYNKPLMIIIVLMLALVNKPTMTWTRMNMLQKLMNETNNPMEKGSGNKSITKVGEQILQSPAKDQPNWSCQGCKYNPCG